MTARRKPSAEERDAIIIPLRPRTEPRWWDDDRARHLRDRPEYCPRCGGSIIGDGGIAVEYWEAENRIYHCWCRDCGWAGDIIRIDRMIGHEPEH